MFFTHIAQGNPYRTWLEYFGNWKLIERSEGEIRRLVAGCKGHTQVSIGMDTTGLTYLVDVRKA